MEHLELEFLALADLGLVEIDDVVVADAEARGVEIEFGLLLAGDADPHLALFGHGGVEQVDLLLVVDHGNRVLEAVVEQLGDVLDVLRTLESVADDVAVLVEDAAVVEGVDDVDVVGRRGLQVDVVLHRLFEHEREVARLGAVAVVVRTVVVDLGHRHVEHAFGTVDLLRNLRQVGDLERRAVLLDELHQRNVVELQLPLLHRELVLGKIEGLFDQIDVLVFHGVRFVNGLCGFDPPRLLLLFSAEVARSDCLFQMRCKVDDYFRDMQQFVPLFRNSVADFGFSPKIR